MAHGKSVTHEHPCPICGEDGGKARRGWCSWLDVGVKITCMHSAEQQAWPGWRRLSKKPGRAGGVVWLRDDEYERTKSEFIEQDTDAKARREAEKKKRRAEEQKDQRRREASAESLWKMAKAGGSGWNHPRAKAYIEARGVPISQLPGGTLPKSMRFMPDCPRDGRDDGISAAPAIVCAATDCNGRVLAVQRIFLDPTGEPKKYGAGESAKQARGSFALGPSIRLSDQDNTGTLILCEGAETGEALAAATQMAVWSLVSCSNFGSWRPDPTQISGGWLKRIVIAGDTDKSEAGQKAARVFAERLRTEFKEQGLTIRVDVALPDRRMAPRLFDEDGTPAGGGKSVDWLDIFNELGPKRTADAVLGSGAPERLPVFGETREIQAQQLLKLGFMPANPGPDQTFSLAYFRWEHWVHPRDDENGWVKADPSTLVCKAKFALDGFFEVKRKGLEPLCPTMTLANEVLNSSLAYVTVEDRDMPCWLPAAFDEHGEPIKRHRLTFRKSVTAGPIPPHSVIAAPNCLLDADALGAGSVRAIPPTSRWFSAVVLPNAIDLDLLRELVQADADEDEAAQRAIFQRVCPTWMGFIPERLGNDPLDVENLCRYMGYLLTSDIRLEKSLWLQGLSGSGKSVVIEVIQAMLGDDNCGMGEIDQLGGRFEMASVIGRRAWIFDEARVGHQTNQAAALDRLLRLIAGGRSRVEGKFGQADPNASIPIKFIFAVNQEMKLTDAAAAVVRRYLPIRFRPFTGTPDRTLKDRLRAEAAGVTLWALMGLMRLKRAVHFGQEPFPLSETSHDLLQDIRRRSSPVQHFVEEMLVTGPGNHVKINVLFDLWRRWAKTNGHELGSDSTFGSNLRAAIEVARRQISYMGKRPYWYVGVRPKMVREVEQLYATRETVFVDSLEDVDCADLEPADGEQQGTIYANAGFSGR